MNVRLKTSTRLHIVCLARIYSMLASKTSRQVTWSGLSTHHSVTFLSHNNTNSIWYQ